jgi:hypothetical protein
VATSEDIEEVMKTEDLQYCITISGVIEDYNGAGEKRSKMKHVAFFRRVKTISLPRERALQYSV